MKQNIMPSIPISVGELVDKITILKIKSQNISDIDKLHNVKVELEALETNFNNLKIASPIDSEITELEKVNNKLWVIEDEIREKEKNKEFDNIFIKLARSVYKVNDERANIKKIINQKTGSLFVEEKSYSNY
tara:strand:+ start:122 stop:517 length:396 start_codon:yes stop_codon:yes gene_type:complete